MNKNETPLSASITSVTGIQVTLIGILMFCLGILIGTNLVGIPAWQSIVQSSPQGITPSVPEYLELVSQINMGAAIGAGISLLALLYVDYTMGDEDG